MCPSPALLAPPWRCDAAIVAIERCSAFDASISQCHSRRSCLPLSSRLRKPPYRSIARARAFCASHLARRQQQQPWQTGPSPRRWCLWAGRCWPRKCCPLEAGCSGPDLQSESMRSPLGLATPLRLQLVAAPLLAASCLPAAANLRLFLRLPAGMARGCGLSPSPCQSPSSILVGAGSKWGG